MTEDDLGFDFQETKQGALIFFRNNKPVVTVKGKKASQLLNQLLRSDFANQQLIMAKATGHYKQGNERASKTRSKPN